MNRKEHLLSIVAEECAEVAHRASKAARFGLDEIQDGQDFDNRQRILIEFADLCGALELLNEGSVIEQVVNSLRPLINQKRAKIKKFLAYSEICGTLTGEESSQTKGGDHAE